MFQISHSRFLIVIIIIIVIGIPLFLCHILTPVTRVGVDGQSQRFSGAELFAFSAAYEAGFAVISRRSLCPVFGHDDHSPGVQNSEAKQMVEFQSGPVYVPTVTTRWITETITLRCQHLILIFLSAILNAPCQHLFLSRSYGLIHC